MPRKKKIAPETDADGWLPDERRLRDIVLERQATADMEYVTYGYGSHIEPLDFLPDLECSSPDERESWVHACQTQEQGDAVDRSRVDHISTYDDQGKLLMHMALSGWGLGVGYYRRLAETDAAAAS